MQSRPGRSRHSSTGLLVLLLTGPVAVILAASVIGILVVPFVLCAVVMAWIIGKVGVSVRLGDGMTGQASPVSRLQSVRSFVIGFAAITLIYMVPVLGFLAWALVGVTGLGAASLAFASAYRRENPARPKPTPPPPPPVPPRPLNYAADDVGVTPSAVAVDDVQSAPSPPYGAAPAAYVQTGAATNLLALPESRLLRTCRGVCPRRNLRPHHLRRCSISWTTRRDRLSS